MSKKECEHFFVDKLAYTMAESVKAIGLGRDFVYKNGRKTPMPKGIGDVSPSCLVFEYTFG